LESITEEEALLTKSGQILDKIFNVYKIEFANKESNKEKGANFKQAKFSYHSANSAPTVSHSNSFITMETTNSAPEWIERKVCAKPDANDTPNSSNLDNDAIQNHVIEHAIVHSFDEIRARSQGPTSISDSKIDSDFELSSQTVSSNVCTIPFHAS